MTAFGMMRLAEWVKVNAPENRTDRVMPADSVPKDVIVVTPVTVTAPSSAVERSVVVADAMLAAA